MSSVLIIDQVSKSYGRTKAVIGVSLEVASGECYVLAGPNGAGKTTLVKMVCGVLGIDGGTITVAGSDIQTEPVKAKLNLGYIPDDPFAYPYLTGRQVLQYVGDLHGLTRQQGEKQIKRLLAYYPIKQLLDGRFGDYSRGNKQKVMIMASLLHQPKLLVIDEPIVGLDAEAQRMTKKLLDTFIDEGGAVLMSTHTLAFAQEVATDIGLIDRGRLLMEGSLAQLKKRLKVKKSSLEALYLKALETDEA